MRRLEPEVEREVRRLAAKGHTLREIGRMLGCSRHAVTNTLRRAPRPSTTAWNPSPARLSLREREEIWVGLERGDTLTALANRIRRAVSTVSREVNANGGRDRYRAHLAHQVAFDRARRPKAPKLACPPRPLGGSRPDRARRHPHRPPRRPRAPRPHPHHATRPSRRHRARAFPGRNLDGARRQPPTRRDRPIRPRPPPRRAPAAIRARTSARYAASRAVHRGRSTSACSRPAGSGRPSVAALDHRAGTRAGAIGEGQI